MYAFGLSPFLPREAKDPVYREIVRFILEGAPTGASVGIYDAFNLRTISRFDIPRMAAFESGKTRATQFRQAIQETRAFLATNAAPPSASGLVFDQALRLPQFLDFVSRHLAVTNREVVVTFLGSPLYVDEKEPAFSMVHGYFPSDGHLLASRDQSVFGLAGRDHALDRVMVHSAYFGDPWTSELHQEKVSRFWTLYVQRQGGRFASFSGDLPTVFAALRDPLPSQESTATVLPIDPSHAKVEMLRITRDVGATDWISRDEVNHPALNPPDKTVGPMKIGIRWKGDLDLDLYARPAPQSERLYFEHTRSPEGFYYKDHRSSPDREYEFIEFQEPIDARDVEASVNFYEGHAPGGAQGEVRVEFEGRIYSGRFTVPAELGNRGREGRSQARSWLGLDIPALLKLR